MTGVVSNLARSPLSRWAWRVPILFGVFAPLALVAVPARELVREEAQWGHAQLGVRRGATVMPHAERAILESRVDELAVRVARRTPLDLDPLAARTLLEVFANERGLALTELTCVREFARADSDGSGDSSRTTSGDLRCTVAGQGSLEAWLGWLDLLSEHAILPGVERYHFERVGGADNQTAATFDARLELVFLAADGGTR